jgi:hypothetical protein
MPGVVIDGDDGTDRVFRQCLGKLEIARSSPMLMRLLRCFLPATEYS